MGRWPTAKGALVVAGDWIKVEHATPDKPEVVLMSSILKIDQDAVTGKLLRVWTLAESSAFPRPRQLAPHRWICFAQRPLFPFLCVYRKHHTSW